MRTFLVFILLSASMLFTEKVRNETNQGPAKVSSSSTGSFYVQNKPDTPQQKTVKLAKKVKKYWQKMELEEFVNLCSRKPRKFRKFRTYMLILQTNGSILVHSGDKKYNGLNISEIKEDSPEFYISGILERIQKKDPDDYSLYYSSKENKLLHVQWIHQESLNDEYYLVTVCVKKYS